MCRWSISKSWTNLAVVEALILENQVTYKVSPQHWPHTENAVRKICIHFSFSAIFYIVLDN